jgi:hypothetical protein
MRPLVNAQKWLVLHCLQGHSDVMRPKPLPHIPTAVTHPLQLLSAATCPLTYSLAPPAPVSLYRKETGTPTAAAAQLVQGFAAFPLVTIGVTNTEVTSNSDADDGAAADGMDCT